MPSIIKELFTDVRRQSTVIFVDDEGVGIPRQYQIVPRRILIASTAILLAVIALTASIIAFTPVRQSIPGYGTEELRRDAAANAMRLTALQDSIDEQQKYIDRIRRIMTGEVPDQDLSLAMGGPDNSRIGPGAASADDGGRAARSVDNFTRAVVESRSVLPIPIESENGYLATMAFPSLPPVDGFKSRGYDASRRHYGVDIAVQEGAIVRSIGDGYVVFADWTFEGGYAIALQHANGYLSVYKHNSQLLKRSGEYVRDREAVALSGNSGEVSTGPHLHFELWRSGIAQDPDYYFVNW